MFAAWLVIQVAETIFPLFGFGDTPARLVVIMLAIGFPLFLVFSWIFEITPEGFRRETDKDRTASTKDHGGKQLDRIIIVLMALALGYFTFDKFVLDPARDARLVKQTTQQARSDVLVESYGDQSIAVLPFENMSEDASNVYFSDGITEEILNLLAKVRQLRVVSRSSAFAFRGKDIHIPDVARKLNVAHVLEGSVRRAGNQVRITVQLIDARSDTHLWSETYERTLKDVFAVQDEIALAVTAAMKLTLVGESPAAEVTGTQAYELYLQAQHFYRQRSAIGYEKAVEYSKKVIALDPHYSRVWGTLGGTYTIQAAMGLIPYDEGYGLALEASEKALSLDPNNPRAHTLRGWIAMMYENNYALAALHFRHALGLQPNDSVGTANAATFAHVLGRLQQAIKLQKRSLMLNPISPIPHVNLSQIYNALGMLEDAETAARKALELNSGISGAPAQLAIGSLLRGEAELALEQAEVIKLEVMKGVILAIAHNELGNTDDSSRSLELLITDHAESSAYYIAMVFTWQGDSDSAFNWLQRAVDEGQDVDAIKTEALLKNLHEDSRWEELLTHLGLADVQVAAIEF